jgi:hypothetical protein
MALAGGIWARCEHVNTDAIVSSDEVRAILNHSGLQVIGSFEEPVSGLIGFEVTRPDCALPIALLPVAATGSVLMPSAFRYRDGDYRTSYIYSGNTYGEKWISYRLRILALFYRARWSLENNSHKEIEVYFKLWTPESCPDLASEQVSKLSRFE